MAVITDGQIELRADDAAALVIGPGTSYQFTTDWVSWWAAPAVRTSDIARGGVDGVLAGRDLLGSHMTPIVVQIIADTALDLGNKIDAWKAACAVSSDAKVTVRANLLGRTRRRVGRFRVPGEVIPRGRITVGGHVANGGAQFEALDPYTYGDLELSAVVTREVEGSGFTVPFTPPFTVGTASTGGAISIVNGGNANAPWTARLDGALTNPEITHTQSGKRLAFFANGGINLTVGQHLAIDSAARSILLDGVSDRRSQLTIDSDWWDLVPGTNDFTLRADAGTGTLTVYTRDAWLS